VVAAMVVLVRGDGCRLLLLVEQGGTLINVIYAWVF